MELPVFERTISGRGVLQIPEEYQKALDVFLYTQLLRPNRTEYLNVAYNPGRKFLANVTFCIDEYVYADYAINYDNQVIQIFDGQASQNLLSLICAHDDVLDSFTSFAVALGIFVSRNNSIKEHKYKTFVPNRLRFVCYGTTALRISLRGNAFSQCDEQDGTPTPPPPKPVPLPPLPPDEPVEVSPPYDGVDDGGDTRPIPIDDYPVDAPPTEQCLSYAVTYRLITPTYPNNLESSVGVLGVIRGIRITTNPDGTQNADMVAGKAVNGVCTQNQLYSLVINAAPPLSAEILSVEQLL